MEVQGYRQRVNFVRMGDTDRQARTAPFARTAFLNRQSVRVRDDAAEFLINGHPVHQEERLAGPWLALNADHGRVPVFANLRLSGNPVIPRQVSLLAGDDLTGWLAVRYGESREQASPAEQQLALVPAVLRTSVPTIEHDWWAEADTIRGQRVAADAPRQSLLSYHRPLLENERISYEFLYVPGETAVHPALGRITFLLEPEGVALHWLTDGDPRSDRTAD